MIRKPAGNFVGAFVQHLCTEKDLDIAPLAIHLISPILTILTHISPICCTHPSHVCIPPIPCICAPHMLNTPIWPSSMNLEDVLDNVGKIKQDLLSSTAKQICVSASKKRPLQIVQLLDRSSHHQPG